jgi:hypothetical protein
MKVKGLKMVLGFQRFDLIQNRLPESLTQKRDSGGNYGGSLKQSSLAKMKPKPTLNTMGVQFSLQELGENIQWTGVWVGFGQGIRRTQNS